MRRYVNKRVREGSTWAGLAAVVAGLGLAFKVDEAPQIADAIVGAAPALSTGDWLGGLVALAGGVAMALRDGTN